jgi:hypothetical protein
MGSGRSSSCAPLLIGLLCKQDGAEVHWYEAHGIGKRKMKIKRFLD